MLLREGCYAPPPSGVKNRPSPEQAAGTARIFAVSLRIAKTVHNSFQLKSRVIETLS